jgi:hypothetical protein
MTVDVPIPRSISRPLGSEPTLDDGMRVLCRPDRLLAAPLVAGAYGSWLGSGFRGVNGVTTQHPETAANEADAGSAETAI